MTELPATSVDARVARAALSARRAEPAPTITQAEAAVELRLDAIASILSEPPVPLYRRPFGTAKRPRSGPVEE